MNSMKRIIATIALVAGMASVNAAPVYLEIATYNESLEFGSNAWATDLYANISFKINQRYSFTPETSSTLSYNRATGAMVGLSHGMLRVVVTDKKLAKVGDWNLAMSYRYTAPTSAKSQAAGTLGDFMFRPALSSTIGPVSVTVRNGLTIPMNRGAYQVNPVGSANPTGNPLIRNSFEILPGMELAPNLDASVAWIMGQDLKGAAKGATGTSWGFSTYMALETGYTHKNLNDWRTALRFETAAGGTFADSFKILKKANSYFSVVLDKTF